MANAESPIPSQGDRASSDGLAELNRQRHENDRRLEGTLYNIYEKYSHDFTEIGDEIDLETGLLTVDNGHLAHMKHERDLGRTSARRFIRAFTANLLDEQSDTVRENSPESESGSWTEASGNDGTDVRESWATWAIF